MSPEAEKNLRELLEPLTEEEKQKSRELWESLSDETKQEFLDKICSIFEHIAEDYKRKS